METAIPESGTHDFFVESILGNRLEQARDYILKLSRHGRPLPDYFLWIVDFLQQYVAQPDHVSRLTYCAPRRQELGLAGVAFHSRIFTPEPEIRKLLKWLQVSPRLTVHQICLAKNDPRTSAAHLFALCLLLGGDLQREDAFLRIRDPASWRQFQQDLVITDYNHSWHRAMEAARAKCAIMERGHLFFTSLKKLPMDLQCLLCRVVCARDDRNGRRWVEERPLIGRDFEPAITALARMMRPRSAPIMFEIDRNLF